MGIVMAEPFLWGSPFSLPSGIQFPSMTALSNGTFLVLGKTGTFPDLKLKAWIYNADGSLKAEQILVVPDHKVPGVHGKLEVPAIDPMAVEMPDGRIAITWTVHTPSSGNTYVAPWVCIYGADLTPVGVPQPVFDPVSGARDYAESAAALDDGTLVISARNELDGHAYLRVISPDGTRSAALDLGLAGSSEQGAVLTDVAALADGKVAVVVRENISSLKGYVLTPSGAGGPSLSTPFSISTSTSLTKASVKVTALQGGGFVVTWMEKGSAETPDFNTFFRVYDSDGDPISDMKPVSPLTFPDLLFAGHSDVLALPNGGFAVAYEKATGSIGGVPGLEVHLAIFDNDGERLADDVRVSQEATTSVYLEELHLMADGRILVRHSQGIQIVDPRTEGISLTGTNRDDQYIGTAFNDMLAGGTGDDILDGGAGRDILIGGAGNDTYKANASDVIEDSAGSNDTVILISGERYTMAASIETLIIAADLQGVTATGNELRNTLTGNRFGNTLDGGVGADTLDGGGGFDFASYAGETSGVTVNLATGANPDGDTLISIEGVIGSSHADTFTGNGSSLLMARGSDDTYTVRSGDVVEEADNEGRDTVIVGGSYALKADAYIELLRLSGVSSKTSANLTGSDTANEITGHTGKNTLKGLGGNDVLKASSGDDRVYGDAGNDTLYGGSGNDKLYGGTGTGRDVFVFDTKPSKSTNVDRIYDFSTKYDSIQLENKIFTKLGRDSSKGVKFKSDMFVKGKAAQDREDRIIYDSKTGALYYDQDGTGSKAQVKITTLNKNLKLTHSDFFVI
jgi:Ca2+-binding RTX toxin-like protein